MFRRFRYRFYPNPEQELLLRRTLGCARLVYNRALHERVLAWTNGKQRVTYAEQDKALTAWKKTPELAFLNDVSSVALQQSIRHLQTAYHYFFTKKAGYPRFKKKHGSNSASFTRSGFSWRKGAIYLAKLRAPLDIRWSRPLPPGANPSGVAITLTAAGRWFISILVDDDNIQALAPVESAIGVDLGIVQLLTLHNGETVSNPRFDLNELARKQRLSRRLRRKKGGSRNYEKARIKLARFHARIGDRRRDHHHKLSTQLVRENQVIVVESLNIKAMVRDRRFGQGISDAGWATLIDFLQYKCSWYGRTLVKVSQHFPSSKTCSACGWVLDDLPPARRRWTCPSCKAQHDRDENAAQNILAAGLAVVQEDDVCGPDVSQQALRGLLQLGLKQKISLAKVGSLGHWAQGRCQMPHGATPRGA